MKECNKVQIQVYAPGKTLFFDNFSVQLLRCQMEMQLQTWIAVSVNTADAVPVMMGKGVFQQPVKGEFPCFLLNIEIAFNRIQLYEPS